MSIDHRAVLIKSPLPNSNSLCLLIAATRSIGSFRSPVPSPPKLADVANGCAGVAGVACKVDLEDDVFGVVACWRDLGTPNSGAAKVIRLKSSCSFSVAGRLDLRNPFGTEYGPSDVRSFGSWSSRKGLRVGIGLDDEDARAEAEGSRLVDVG